LQFFLISAVVLWASAWFGETVVKKRRTLEEDERQHFSIINGATLTFLALISGFFVAMAINSYDERTNNEKREANVIGIEYLHIGVLADNDANTLRRLLEEYLNDRITLTLPRFT
jgi:heme/copper-type cytochrome/quinol oxidase subunit 3